MTTVPRRYGIPGRSLVAGATLAVSMAFLAPDGSAAPLKSYQSGTTTIAATTSSTTITLSPTVDPTKAFLVFGVSEDTNLPTDGQVSGQITTNATDPACPGASTCATFLRAGTGGALTVKWYVVEFASGVSVQRGSALLPALDPGPAPLDVLLSPVNLAKSFPIISLRTPGSIFDTGDLARAEITTSTNLHLRMGKAAPNAIVEWQVVEYTDANVQTNATPPGDVTLQLLNGSSSVTAPVAPVNTARSWLIYSYDCIDSSTCEASITDVGSKLVRGRITAANQLTFDRPATNTAGDMNITWYLVEFTDATTVQSGTEPFTAAETQRDVPLSAVPGGQSIALGGGEYQRGGRSPYALDDIPGVAWFTFDVTSSTNLRITRGTTGPGTPATADVGWFVVTFFPSIHYRSIGTALDVSGTLSATLGSDVVTDLTANWQTANRGRGDRIGIGGTDYTVLAVDSETQLRLTIPFAAASGPYAYTLSRQFGTLQGWENCISAGVGCTYFPVAGGNLVADGRREVGIAYDDAVGADFTSGLVIDGSTTDTVHRITLTVDPGNRHNGSPGTGVLVDGQDGPNEIFIRDSNVTVEWLEVVRVRGANNVAAFRIQGVIGNLATNAVVQDVLIHNFFEPTVGFDVMGIRLSGDDVAKSVTIRNCMIWDGDAVGIEGDAPSDTATIQNCSIDGMARGIDAIASTLTIQNTIVTSSVTADYSATAGGTLAGSNNMDSDGTAPPTNRVTSTAAALFVTPNADLHLKTGANPAVDSGLDLSSSFWNDVDGQSRLGLPWDRGADERGAPTAVALLSFEATGSDSAVELSWTTASELQNLGFHLYRATSGEGSYERVTRQPIPGLGSSPSGASYRYTDSGLENGVTYFYQLEDIETTGKTELHGPVSATPLAGAPGSSPASSSLITYGHPESNGFRVLERTSRGVLLELVTEGFTAEPQEDGSVLLSIPGFEPLAGSPSVPVLRPWVDAISGRGVRITEVRESSVESFESFRPSGAGKVELVANRRGTVRARRGPAGTFVGTTGLVPVRRVRLLQQGYLGETRKAQLELAPLRWNGTSGELDLARRLTVRLSFEGGVAEGRPRRARARGIAARLVATEEGLQEVSYEELFPKGRGAPVDSLRLTHLGKPVAFHVEPEGARFARGSKLYFVSEGPDVNPYGSELVYELEVGARGVLMERGSAAPSGELLQTYSKTEDYEENHLYQAGLVEAPDLWLWDVLLAPVTKNFAFEVTSLTPGPSRFTVWLQGVSDFTSEPDHHVRVYVNDVFHGELFWDGKNPRTLELELPEGSLREGGNLLQIENVGDTEAPYSMVMLDRFQVIHPRRTTSEEGSVEGTFPASGAALVSGLGPSHLMETTGENPVWLSGADVSAEGELRFRAEAGRSYLAVSRGAVHHPVVRSVAPVRLKKETLSADYLVVGPAAFSSEAAPLLSHRGRQGLKVKFASLEDVYAEFGYGEARPEAIRDFLSYAYHNWREPKLRYVLLLGDATYDFKDYLKTGVENQLPPLLVKTSYLWTASDPSIAAVHGEDILPDLAIGRLPAASPLELRAMVSKILAYEAGGPGLDGLLVLATDNSDGAGDFVGNAEEIARGVPAGRSVRKLYLNLLGSSMRGEILSAFDEGPSLVSYIGHGGIHLWANENVFNTSDVGSLAPQPREPLLLTMNCLNGYFHFPYFDSLAEKLLKAEGRGAVAAFSPSGLSLNEPAHRFHQALLEELFHGAHQRLGDAVVAAQADYAATGAFPELLEIYHLLGDPALRIR